MESNYTEGKSHVCSTVESGGPAVPAFMFGAGILGNVLALLLLGIRRRNQSPYLFHILVTALMITDLLGTFSVSPLVIAAYTKNESLVGMSGDNTVCNHFGFSMTFFSLVTFAILLSMALERWLAIGHPYFYERNTSKRCGYIAISFIYLVCVLFCILPFVGAGRYVQYFPGTWCFIDMHASESKHRVFALIYATCISIMIILTVICYVSVIYHLILMYRRRKTTQGSIRRTRGHRSLSIAQEGQHLILLGVMTVAFIVCSLPLVIRGYINFWSTKKRDIIDRLALRFLSLNPIIDPWLFIILNPSVLRFLWGKLKKAPSPTPHPAKASFVRPAPRSPPMELHKPAVLP
ncbi:prostaglandin E receptor 2b subtype EP2 [Chanos chanos]|uniref:Prostaglandin E receptor 2b subtype EP2 n=1 Tax=Chanos chanos TaxID=29144 RepID=A0A6J2V4G0_CHACN|nr:prostaglandin E2 receptor EP2 subtype-like [Chanos chanos]